MTITTGDRFQENGKRGRVFTVTGASAHGFARCTFEGGSKRRGESRTVTISWSTLRRYFTVVS